MLRWHLQQGRSAIPKSDQGRTHRRELRRAGFELTTDQLAQIDALDTGVRGGPEPDSINLENAGMPIPEA